MSKIYTQEEVKALIVALVENYNEQGKWAMECTREMRPSDVMIAANNALGITEKWAATNGKEVEPPECPETPENPANAKSHGETQADKDIAILQSQITKWKNEADIRTYRITQVEAIANELIAEAVAIAKSGLTHSEKRGAAVWLENHSAGKVSDAKYCYPPKGWSKSLDMVAGQAALETDGDLPF